MSWILIAYIWLLIWTKRLLAIVALSPQPWVVMGPTPIRASVECWCYRTTDYSQKANQIADQTYLINFYQSLGFEPLGQPYEEDGLDHIDMVLNVAKRKKAVVPAIAKEVTVKSVLSNLLLFLVAIGIIGLLYLLI